jgi:hypothetical protein
MFATLAALVAAMQIATTAPAPMWAQEQMIEHSVLESQEPFKGYCEEYPDTELCSATEESFTLPLDKSVETRFPMPAQGQAL